MAESRITAVLVNYKRTKNTHQIIDCLKSQTLKPEIIVWNNNDELFENPNVDWVINSSKNAHAHPLPFLYQYCDTEYICRMDDDLSFADDRVFEDVANYMDNREKNSSIVAAFGVILQDGKTYRESLHVGAGPNHKKLERDTPVDIIKGRLLWFRQEFAERIPFNKSHFHVDLTTSFVFSGKKRLYHIVPQFLSRRIIELPEVYDDKSGKGYSSQKGHYEIRNRLTEEWLD